jgi:hypothetical protein
MRDILTIIAYAAILLSPCLLTFRGRRMARKARQHGSEEPRATR